VKIVISGRPYEAVSVNRASLAQLLALKRTSGLGLDVLKEAALHFEAMVSDPDIPAEEKGIALISDERGLLAIAATVWLSRWAAGERLSFEEANEFPLTELGFDQEPGDVAEEPSDPQ
jgi:hypothetical protein